MYSLPISDTRAIAVDDNDEEKWLVHDIDYATKSVKSFTCEGLGEVTWAYFNREDEELWVVASGSHVAVISLEQEECFEVGEPGEDDAFHVYSVVCVPGAAYVSGEYSNLWRIDLESFDWTPLLKPEPNEEPDDEDDKQRSRRTKEYAAKYPPLYGGVEIGRDIVFFGALGALARVRDGVVERKTLEIAPKARLVAGQVEGTRLCLSADGARGAVFVGDFDAGFELVFSDNQPAFNRSAMHGGRRYLGIAAYPPSDLHNLYVHEDGKPVAVENDCPRDPLGLLSLSSTGAALWVIVNVGIFRFADDAWTLLDVDDLESGDWPA